MFADCRGDWPVPCARVFLFNVSIYVPCLSLSHQLIRTNFQDAYFQSNLSNCFCSVAKMLNICNSLAYLIVTGSSSQIEVRRMTNKCFLNYRFALNRAC